MRHITFTDGVHALAMVGIVTVLATGAGVITIVAGRFVEELARARAARALGGAR